jgi:hypothetical protein
VAYAVENAIFQWEEGERRLRSAEEPARRQLESVAGAVLEELRRRLGSTFTVSELANLYNEDTDWAAEIVERRFAGTDVSSVVDAAFNRYAREAADYGGGRLRRLPERD